MRKLKWVLLALGVVSVPAYFFLFTTSEDADGRWPLDLAAIRTAAHSIEGELPADIRVEKLGAFEFPSTAEVAGTGWSARRMSVYAYQLVYPTRTVMVDTAMDEETAKSESLKDFDAAAWARIQKGIAAADFTVVTHEHFDHLGGLAKNEQAFARALLTTEQLAHEENFKPMKFPAKRPSPLEYTGIKAVAPGVVLIKSPGHTFGSQLVYVVKADGTELLFLGDVAWQTENVDTVRERARMVTLIMGENRKNVLQQLQALHELKATAPEVNQIAGHDGVNVDGLISRHVLSPMFVEAPAVP